MKTLLAIPLLLCAFTVSSQENDWLVGTMLKDGTKLVYEVLPATAEMIVQPELNLYTTVVEMTEIDTSNTLRKRLVVSGCEKGTGKTTFIHMDGSRVEGANIFEWDKNGDKVFDFLAVRVCAAYMIKSKNTLPEIDAPAPTKPKRSGIIT